MKKTKVDQVDRICEKLEPIPLMYWKIIYTDLMKMRRPTLDIIERAVTHKR